MSEQSVRAVRDLFPEGVLQQADFTIDLGGSLPGVMAEMLLTTA